ncbi:MAG: hypothetical protein WCJ30_15515 [Deltaproteobacteria bacterium]
MNADDLITTMGSCSGHGKTSASVEITVRGREGMRASVTAIDAVDLKLSDEVLIDVGVNFSSEVATSCHFGVFPDWTMLAVTIEGRGRGGSPSKRLLAKVAKEFAAAYSAHS